MAVKISGYPETGTLSRYKGSLTACQSRALVFLIESVTGLAVKTGALDIRLASVPWQGEVCFVSDIIARAEHAAGCLSDATGRRWTVEVHDALPAFEKVSGGLSAERCSGVIYSLCDDIGDGAWHCTAVLDGVFFDNLSSVYSTTRKQVVAVVRLAQGAKVEYKENTKARELVYGRESYLSLTSADVAYIRERNLSVETLGEVPALSEDVSDDARSSGNFWDARKWLGRSLGWFQFCAVSIRAALDGAETEEDLKTRFGGPERRLERILHAASWAIRHMSGPYSYLMDGDGMEVCKQADRLMSLLSGEELEKLRSEQAGLVSRIRAQDIAAGACRSRLRLLVGDLIDTNLFDGTGSWTGAWHKNPEVVSLWEAFGAALTLKEDFEYRLEGVTRSIDAIEEGIRSEVLDAVDKDVFKSGFIAELLDVPVREVERQARVLVALGQLKEMPDESGFLVLSLPVEE